MKPKGLRNWDWGRYNGFLLLEHCLGNQMFQKTFGTGRDRFYRAIDGRLAARSSALEESKFKIETDMEPNEFFQGKSRPIHPVVFRGAALGWPCMEKWSLEFFENEYGSNTVIINDNKGFIDTKRPQKFRRIMLADYVRAMRAGSTDYLKFSKLVQDNPELMDDLEMDWLKNFKRVGSFGEAVYFFMGGKTTLTPIHNGFVGTTFVQVKGMKKWTFFDVSDRIYLDARADRRMTFHSDADPDDMSDPRFPLLKYAKKFEVVIRPRDILWIPPFVWHQVENVSDTNGIAYKFPNVLEFFRSSKILTVLFFLATRPNVFKAFWVSRTKGEGYVFTKAQEEIDS